VTAPDAGNVDRIFVKPGDRVTAGQSIALIRRPARLDELLTAQDEAKAGHDRHQTLEQEVAAQDRLQANLLTQTRKTNEDRIQSLEAQKATLAQRLQGEAELRANGMFSAVKLFETETQLAQINNEIATTRNRQSELALNYEQQAGRRRQDLADRRNSAQNLARRAENLRREYERDRQVLASSAGIVAEIGVNLDDPVSPGQVIVRLLADHVGDVELTAVVYLPAAEGKKVKAEMAALVTPSTVKVELEGYVMGRVLRVSELPASREGLLRRLKNAAQVEEILKGGTPFEVEIALQRDATTPSGYAWTSGQGPDISIEPGTLVRGEVVVSRVHIISLVFPAMDYVFGWFKAL
jgi:HlyD family secretion protein